MVFKTVFEKPAPEKEPERELGCFGCGEIVSEGDAKWQLTCSSKCMAVFHSDCGSMLLTRITKKLIRNTKGVQKLAIEERLKQNHFSRLGDCGAFLPCVRDCPGFLVGFDHTKQAVARHAKPAREPATARPAKKVHAPAAATRMAKKAHDAAREPVARPAKMARESDRKSVAYQSSEPARATWPAPRIASASSAASSENGDASCDAQPETKVIVTVGISWAFADMKASSNWVMYSDNFSYFS